MAKKHKSQLIKMVDHQVGKSNFHIDARRSAYPPGERKTAWGTTYWETRKNRSDYRGRT